MSKRCNLCCTRILSKRMFILFHMCCEGTTQSSTSSPPRLQRLRVSRPNNSMARRRRAMASPRGRQQRHQGSSRHRLLFKSKDFLHWQFADRPLHSVPGTGMWECPDFYPVRSEGMQGLDSQGDDLHSPVKHVLKISSDDLKHDYYSVGVYDSKSDTYEPAVHRLDTGIGLRYDYGKFYASKSFFDPSTNRRILLGWSNESDSIQDDFAKGWSSIQVRGFLPSDVCSTSFFVKLV